MLVLTRKEDQVIRIGKDIKIVLVAIQGDRARIGIDAPSEIPVHRQEIYEQIIRENPPGDNTLGIAKFDNPK